MNSVNYVFENFDSLSDNKKTEVLLYNDPRFDKKTNKFILDTTISYVKSTERFSGSIFE